MVSPKSASKSIRLDALKKIAHLGDIPLEWLLRGKEVETEAPQLREHAPEIYDARPAFLDRDALAHIILLTRDWLRRKKDKLSALGEADLITRLYDYWLIEHIYPDD